MNINGSICALATPFDSQGRLDFDGWSRLLDFQLEGGTQALVVAGSTGEAHMLEGDEFARLLAHAVRQVNGRVPVIAGTGGVTTDEAIANTRLASELGADAALVVTPWYVRPSQAGLLRHFLVLADAVDLPMILYNVPSRTACDMLPATVLQLREHPRIVGIKEAVADPQRIQAMAGLVNEHFVYLSGDDGSAAQAMLAGAAGTVSVIVNLLPKPFRSMCDAACAGEDSLANSVAQSLGPLLNAMNCAPNPVPVKIGLSALGICGDTVRAPLCALPPGRERDGILAALTQFTDSQRNQ